MKKMVFAIFPLVMSSTVLLAESFQPGNILVSTDDVVYETGLDGQVVQDFATQYPGGYPATEYARDIAVGENGELHVYNGTFAPYMSTYDPLTGSWDHRTHPNFNTANNGSYGGIDAWQNQVYVTDGLTDKGVIAFDMDSGQSVRFAAGTDTIDLTLGLDGLLYLLSPSGSPGGRTIDVYDPASFAYIRSVNLVDIFGWTEHRSIAVDFNGDIFIADWDGEVHRVSADGQLVATITPVCNWIGSDISCSFNDIALSESGQIALGSRFGEIIVTDVDFASITRFQIGNRGAFVEFVPDAGPKTINIDILPGADPNRIHLNKKRYLKVALLSDENFDVTTVDPGSIRFGPNALSIYYGRYRLLDVDGDSDLDMMVRFRVSKIGIQCDDRSLTLSGVDFNGEAFSGSDSIEVFGNTCN